MWLTRRLSSVCVSPGLVLGLGPTVPIAAQQILGPFWIVPLADGGLCIAQTRAFTVWQVALVRMTSTVYSFVPVIARYVRRKLSHLIWQLTIAALGSSTTPLFAVQDCDAAPRSMRVAQSTFRSGVQSYHHPKQRRTRMDQPHIMHIQA